MLRSVFALTAVVLVAAATGCAMCAHPFDYCGPTFTGGHCEACNPDARAGSILSPPIQTMSAGEQAVPEGVVEPIPEPTAGTDEYLSQESHRPAESNRVTAGTRVAWR